MENIFQAMPGGLAYFPIGMGCYLNISTRKMTLGTEKSETSSNILTIYPIQSKLGSDRLP